MNEYLLPKAFSSLTDSELRKLKKTIKTTNTPQRDDLLNLFDYLKKRLQNGSLFRQKRQSKSLENFSNSKLRNQMMDLINDLFISDYLDQHKHEKLKIISNIWSTRLGQNQYLEELKNETETIFTHFVEKWQKEIDSLNEGIDQFQHQFWIHKLTFEAQHTNRDKYDLPFLDHLNYCLDHIYVIQKLRISCDQVLRSKYLKMDSEIELVSCVLQLAEKLSPSSSTIQTYLPVYQILTKDQTTLDDLEEIFQNLQHSYNFIDKKQVHILLRYVTNCCIGQYMNTSDKAFLELQLKMEKWGIEKKVLIYEGNLSDNLFLNIINSACGLDQFELAQKFLNDYKELLIPSYKEASTLLAESYILFFQKHYEEALCKVEKINTRLPRFMIRKKSLKLRICFELLLQPHSNIVYDDIKSLCMDFHNFIKRDTYKLAVSRKDAYLNYVNAIKDLNHTMEFNNNNMEETKASVVKRLNKQRAIAKEWLFEKVSQL